MNNPDKPDAKGDACCHLSLVVENDRISGFFPLLQQGVMIKAQVGCSIQVFLGQEVGVTGATIERIQSIFLDGSPVDDLNAAMVRDGSVLALSAAMPGLVGATLRRGGAYSSSRNTITYHEDRAQCVPGEGYVQIKIFNLLMSELGPGLLKKGIYVKSAALQTFLSEQSPDFWQECRQALLDGNAVGPQTLPDAVCIPAGDTVFLSITSPERKA